MKRRLQASDADTFSREGFPQERLGGSVDLLVAQANISL